MCACSVLKHWQQEQEQQPRRYIPARVVCHWLSELRHVRSHAHKEKEENLPHSGTRYTPTPVVVVVPIYPHNNNMGQQQHRGVKSHTANGFLVHHFSLPSPFSFQYISASTFSFFSLLVHCARSERSRRRRGRSFSLVAITQFSLLF
jgi:hypothetical protein